MPDLTKEDILHWLMDPKNATESRILIAGQFLGLAVSEMLRLGVGEGEILFGVQEIVKAVKSQQQAVPQNAKRGEARG